MFEFGRELRRLLSGEPLAAPQDGLTGGDIRSAEHRRGGGAALPGPPACSGLGLRERLPRERRKPEDDGLGGLTE